MGVEVQHLGKVLKGIEGICIISAAGHQHISDTVYQRLLQPLLRVQLVQFFQQAVALYCHQSCHIIVQIIVDHILRNLHKEMGKVAGVSRFTETVTQRFLYLIQITVLQLP
ncbi:MAG: hypothetical protein IJB59_07285 [Oscillospiraceae bacterium]|nr:hypothetical protein [Oscillospiraceae bacterium]